MRRGRVSIMKGCDFDPRTERGGRAVMAVPGREKDEVDCTGLEQDQLYADIATLLRSNTIK